MSHVLLPTMTELIGVLRRLSVMAEEQTAATVRWSA